MPASFEHATARHSAGDGALREEVDRAAAETGRIVALGRIPYRDVPGVMANATIGLVPITDPGGRSSLAGISPLKLYELLACGVPVVVTDLPGLSEIVRDEDCGRVIPVDDSAAMARAVRSLADDPDSARAMGDPGPCRGPWRPFLGRSGEDDPRLPEPLPASQAHAARLTAATLLRTGPAR